MNDSRRPLAVRSQSPELTFAAMVTALITDIIWGPDRI